MRNVLKVIKILLNPFKYISKGILAKIMLKYHKKFPFLLPIFIVLCSIILIYLNYSS
jgi:hypothetical protein